MKIQLYDKMNELAVKRLNDENKAIPQTSMAQTASVSFNIPQNLLQEKDQESKQLPVRDLWRWFKSLL